MVQALDSSIANRMVARLMTLFELKPQHLTFFAGAATDLIINGAVMKGGNVDTAEWCHYAMYWRYEPKSVTAVKILCSQLK